MPKVIQKPASSVSNVKECITNLCRVLKHGKVCEDISPDSFRLAKSNSIQGEKHMASLIVSVAEYLNGSVDCSEESLETAVQIMKKFKYPRLSHLVAKNENCDESISKELLFSFAWILHCTRLLHIVCQNALQQCSAFNILEKQKNISEPDEFKSDCAIEHSERFSLDSYCNLSSCEKILHMCCRLRKIELLRNRLLFAQNGMAKTEGKVMKETRSSAGYFTPNEMMMLKYPELMKQCEKELESKVQVLQAYTKFKELESSFWTWLDSAYDEKSNDDKQLDSVSPDECPSVKGKMNLLTDKIAELKYILYEKESQWLSVAKENSDKILKLQRHQELEISETVEELYHRIRSIHHAPQFLPLNDSDRPSFRFGEAKYLRNDIKRIDELVESVSESIQQCRAEHATALTDILHSKLGEDVNFVEAANLNKQVVNDSSADFQSNEE